MTQPVAKKSDLGVRTLSAVVMVAVAGTALWLGGWVWTAFVALVALGVVWEWCGLVSGFGISALRQSGWIAFGLIYVATGGLVLVLLRDREAGALSVLATVGTVIAVDIGAYFAGRTFGGPKIAPSISPSKTWSGLIGGAVAATALVTAMRPWTYHDYDPAHFWPIAGLAAVQGILVATVAQTGDFFESWMKRRAGVKDSGKLIPGHGGLFDRVDGLLAVCFAIGILFAGNILAYLALPYPQ